MSVFDFSFGISGIAGEGIVTAGKIIAELFSQSALHVFKFDDYSAEIRGGGKSSTYIRLSSKRRYTPKSYLDLIILTSGKYVMEEKGFITDETLIIYDKDQMESPLLPGKNIGLPFTRILKESGAGPRSKNILIIAILHFLFHIPEIEIKSSLKKFFQHKPATIKEKVVTDFEQIFQQLHHYLHHTGWDLSGSFSPSQKQEAFILDGNTALALGALDADIQLYAGYPITPATPIMEFMARELPLRDKMYLQMEDEIAAISAVVGSWFGGNRAMTATSGPGLSLMTEMLNFVFMSEIPCVIVDVQRAGPATGMPTKTEQSDLLLSIFGGSGDFSRIVLAPTTIEEAYSSMHLAFQLAEKYQLPVIVLSDLFLSYHQEKVILSRCKGINGEYRISPDTVSENYHRYAMSEDGISPWEIPGEGVVTYTVTGLEHDVAGNSNYTSENHLRMTQKRLQKSMAALNDIPEPEISGEEDASIGILTWGSLVPVAKEFVETHTDYKMMHSICINPLNKEAFQSFVDSCDVVLIPETNQTGQYATFIKSHIQHNRIYPIGIPSGRPISVAEFESFIKGAVYVYSQR